MKSHHFVLVSTQRGVRLREQISAVLRQNLMKHAPNIQPSVFNSFHMILGNGELQRMFTRFPFCIGTLQQTLQKISATLIGPEKPSHTSLLCL